MRRCQNSGIARIGLTPTPQSWHTGGFRDKKCVNFVNFVNFVAVLHTMNIEGQIHQKNPAMGQTPPFLAMPGFWKLWLLQPLPKMSLPLLTQYSVLGWRFDKLTLDCIVSKDATVVYNCFSK